MSLAASTDPTKTTGSPNQNRYLGFWLWHIVPMVLLVVLPTTIWIPFIHESLANYGESPDSLHALFNDLCFVQAQCQIGMVAAWLVWGAGLWGKRLFVAFGLLPLILLPFLIEAFSGMPLDGRIVPISISVGIFYIAKPFGISVLVVGALSLLGWRITKQSPVEILVRPQQFSLRQLLWALLIAPAMIGAAPYVGTTYLADTRTGRIEGMIAVGGWNVMIAMPVSLLLTGLILSGRSYLWRIAWVLLIAVILVTIGSGVLVSAEGKDLFETRAIDSLCLLIGAEIVFYGISWCWLRKANLAFGRVQHANGV